MERQKIRLYVNQFTHPHAARRAEFDECLRLNLINPELDEIVVLAQSEPWHRRAFASPKSRWAEVAPGSAPDYQRFFQEVNARVASPDDLSIVANADVYFDETIGRIRDYDLEGVCLALSRWERRRGEDPVQEAWDNSQDAWVFQGRVRPLGLAVLPTATLGCDGRLACELRRAGYRVVNPCRDVRCIHLHDSGVRDYGTCLGGPTALVTRCALAGAELRAKRPVRSGVLTFSLLACNAALLRGAIENARAARDVYPGWTCRFYMDDAMPQEIRVALRALNCELVEIPHGDWAAGPLYHLLIADEPGFARWLLRDAGVPLDTREAAAVQEWVDSGLPFHSIRHDRSHDRLVPAHGFGAVRGAIPDMAGQICRWRSRLGAYRPRGADEEFLAAVIWPGVASQALVHEL